MPLSHSLSQPQFSLVFITKVCWSSPPSTGFLSWVECCEASNTHSSRKDLFSKDIPPKCQLPLVGVRPTFFAFCPQPTPISMWRLLLHYLLKGLLFRKTSGDSQCWLFCIWVEFMRWVWKEGSTEFIYSNRLIRDCFVIHFSLGQPHLNLLLQKYFCSFITFVNSIIALELVC